MGKLVEAGADTSLLDESGQTALCVAARWKVTENTTRENARKSKFYAWIKPIQSNFAASWIISQHREGHSECIEHLLKKGTDPDICDKGGRSPLFWTSFHAHAECARLLKEGGAKDLVRSISCFSSFHLNFGIFYPPGITERTNCTGCCHNEGPHWNCPDFVKRSRNLPLVDIKTSIALGLAGTSFTKLTIGLWGFLYQSWVLSPGIVDCPTLLICIFLKFISWVGGGEW